MRKRHIYLLLFTCRNIKDTEENTVTHLEWVGQVLFVGLKVGKTSQVYLSLVLIIKSCESEKRKGEGKEGFISQLMYLRKKVIHVNLKKKKNNLV